MSSERLTQGAHAVVTGGGTGIGAAIARDLSRLGARVTVLGRRAEPLRAMVRELEEATAITCDVTESGAVEAAFAEAIEGQGPIAVLVNNAGAAESAPIARTDEALFRRMLDVNLMGAFHCSKAFLAQQPLPPGGRIVNVASTAALAGFSYISAYCASKHAVLGLTRALAHEFRHADITINAVCPGYTETRLVTGAVERIAKKTGRNAEEIEAEMASGNPHGRLIQPEDVAAAVGWLVLPGAGAINGQAIAVAGGQVT